MKIRTLITGAALGLAALTPATVAGASHPSTTLPAGEAVANAVDQAMWATCRAHDTYPHVVTVRQGTDRYTTTVRCSPYRGIGPIYRGR